VVVEFDIVHQKVVEGNHGHKDEKGVHAEPQKGLNQVVFDNKVIQNVNYNEAEA
jgi:hypothetical protein